ncbi:unnamed protein product [Ectocarpus sp. 13 AM-2016]
MASEYPDYHQIVSTPMDLGTIQENIRQNVYPSLEACAKDVRTVWTNAYLYNPAKSVVAQGARALSKVFEGMYNKINPTDFNYAREPNVDERNKLSRDIYRVEDSQLAEAVQLLEQRCPDAVVRDDEEGYFVVKVEALPSPVFWEVELYLRRRLCNQPDRTKKKIPTTFRPPPDSMARLSGRKRGNDGGGDDAGGGSRGESGERSSGGRDGTGGPSTSATPEVSSGGSDKRRKTDDPAGAAAMAVTDRGSGHDGGGGSVNGEESRAASEPTAVAPGPTPAGPVGGDVLAAPGVGTDESGLGSGATDAVWEDGLFLADTSFREAGDGVGIDVVAAGAPL